MASNTRIFDLDALVASTPKRIVRWKGTDHEIVGVTGNTYLKFLALSAEVNGAAADITEAQAMEANYKLVALLLPTFPMEDLRDQSLAHIKSLTQYVIGEFTEMANEDAKAAGVEPVAGDSEAGESV